MPYKHNADRRRHIPKMSFKVRNWPAYKGSRHRTGTIARFVERVRNIGAGWVVPIELEPSD